MEAIQEDAAERPKNAVYPVSIGPEIIRQNSRSHRTPGRSQSLSQEDGGDESEASTDSNAGSRLPTVPYSSGLKEGQTYFACPVCMTLFESKEIAELHLKCHREGSKLLHCPDCTAVFGNWLLMELHLKSHSIQVAQPKAPIPMMSAKPQNKVQPVLFGKEPLGCPECADDSFSDQVEFQFHLEFHRHDDCYLHCSFCESVTETWSVMQQHLKCHEEVPAHVTVPSDSRACQICFKMLDCEYDVLRHCDAIHSTSSTVPCDVCDMEFANGRQYMEHCKTHTNLSFECSECQVHTRTMRGMREHQKMHQGQEFCCGDCGSVLQSESHAEYHQAVNHRQVEKKSCPLCFRCFSGVEAYNLHNLHFHTDQLSKWPCQKCKFVGRSKQGLQNHQDRQHSKPLKCSDCRYTCQALHTLNKHRHLFHNSSAGNNNNFACSVCSFRAYDNRDLNHHLYKVHRMGRDAYPCQVCDASFSSQVLLDSHIPSHSVVHPLRCRVCTFSTKFRPALYDHIASKHPGVKLSSAVIAVEERIFHDSDSESRITSRTMPAGLEGSDAASPYSEFQQQGPAFQAQQISFQSQQPTFRAQQPTFRAQQPTFRAQQPTFRAQQPTFRAQQPVFRVQEPAFQVPQPAFRAQQPAFQAQTAFQPQSAFQAQQQLAFRAQTAYQLQGASHPLAVAEQHSQVSANGQVCANETTFVSAMPGGGDGYAQGYTEAVFVDNSGDMAVARDQTAANVESLASSETDGRLVVCHGDGPDDGGTYEIFVICEDGLSPILGSQQQ